MLILFVLLPVLVLLFTLGAMPDWLHYPLADWLILLLAFYGWIKTDVTKDLGHKNIISVILAVTIAAFIYNLIAYDYYSYKKYLVVVGIAAPVFLVLLYYAEYRFVNQPRVAMLHGYVYYMGRLPRNNLELIGYYLTLFYGGSIKIIIHDKKYGFKKRSGTFEKDDFNGVPHGYKLWRGQRINDDVINRAESMVGKKWSLWLSCSYSRWFV